MGRYNKMNDSLGLFNPASQRGNPAEYSNDLSSLVDIPNDLPTPDNPGFLGVYRNPIRSKLGIPLDEPVTVSKYEAEAMIARIDEEIEKTASTVKLNQKLSDLSVSEEQIQGSFYKRRITEAKTTFKQVKNASELQATLMKLSPGYQDIQGSLQTTDNVVQRIASQKRADIQRAAQIISM